MIAARPALSHVPPPPPPVASWRPPHRKCLAVSNSHAKCGRGGLPSRGVVGGGRLALCGPLRSLLLQQRGWRVGIRGTHFEVDVLVAVVKGVVHAATGGRASLASRRVGEVHAVHGRLILFSKRHPVRKHHFKGLVLFWLELGAASRRRDYGRRRGRLLPTGGRRGATQSARRRLQAEGGCGLAPA
eukprot:scaffold21940_cov122-Isochrysis_galbana.AAC.2